MRRGAVLLLLLAAGPARADPVSLAPSAVESFNAHYRDAKELMLSDRYEEAIFEFRAAYAIRPEPRLLLNIGHAYMGLKRPKDALAHYLRYQGKLAGGGERAEVEAYIGEARGQIAVQEEPVPSGWRTDGTRDATAEALTETELRLRTETEARLHAAMERLKRERPAETPVYRRWWFWTALGGVAGVAVAGVVTGVVVGTRRSVDTAGLDTRVIHIPGE